MRRVPRRSFALVLSILTGVAAAPPAGQAPGADAARDAALDAARQEAASRAQAAEAARRMQDAAEQARHLAAERVALAARLRDAEHATLDVAQRIDDLARRRADAEARMRLRTESLAPLLPLMERLSLFPGETMLAVPASPEDALRGVLVLKGIGRELEKDAEALLREQAEIDAIARQFDAETPKLAAARSAQASQAAELDRQIAAAQEVRRAAEDESAGAMRRAAAEAVRAETLRGVIAEIEAQRRQAEARAREEETRAERQRREGEVAAAKRRQEALARPSGPQSIKSNAQPRAQLTAPVAGQVARGWGEATEAGPATGISYHAPPNARVVSPCGGKIVFAAPFRSYGRLLIVDCGGGYHVVLAGLERMDVQAGTPVEAGEPVGVMPGWEPGGAGSRPVLYVELRRDGQPVNPAPWLRARG